MKTVRTRIIVSVVLASALGVAALADETKSSPTHEAAPATSSPAAPSPSTPVPSTPADRSAPSAAPAPAAKPADAKASAPTPAPSAQSIIAPRSLDEALRVLERRRADIDFREMAMDDVVSFVAKVGRVNAIVSPEFRLKAQGGLPVVTLKLTDVNLRQVADLIAKTTGSKLILRDGVLQFTTPEDARGKPLLRIFTIAELTFPIRNFPAPDIRLHTGGVRFVQEEESERESPFGDPDHIVELLKKFTGEGTWDDDDVSISADKGKLVVRQYPAVLKEIAAFLAVLRAAK
ncbi:MAG: hypothetical protein K8T90_17610 [Planctomycetes bacterium]|nr:hypothetical protein [Planctomycetota bacterium]